MRQVLFLGNCQAESLAGVYRDRIAPDSGDSVSYIPTAWPLSDAEAELVRAADVVVDQVFDFKQTVALEDLASRGRVVRFPTVSGAFLWPFTGRAHPRNVSFRFLNEGPYPPELGDRYLNRMIADGVDPDEAVARYLELDLADAVDLDKRYEIIIHQQRRRDAFAGSQIAEAIESHFRSECLFSSPYHPGLRLFRLLLADILEKIGADAGAISRTLRLLTRSPLDDVWVPVHPAVAKHFGLSYVAEDQRYSFLEGRFTVAEWARRYMRFEWNPWLAEGAFLAYDLEAGLEKLQIGLLRSPDSARGHALLSEFLYRLDRLEYAAAALYRAIELDHDEPRFKSSLGHVLSRKNEVEAAELAFRQAIELDPDNPATHSALGHTLCALGRFEEAIVPAQRALELDPGRWEEVSHLGNIYAECGYFQEAELAYREALNSRPDNAEMHSRLGRTLAAQGRSDEAIAQIRQALALDPESPHLAAQLAGLLPEQETDPALETETALEGIAVASSDAADAMRPEEIESGVMDLAAIPPMEPEPPSPRPYPLPDGFGSPLQRGCRER